MEDTTDDERGPSSTGPSQQEQLAPAATATNVVSGRSNSDDNTSSSLSSAEEENHGDSNGSTIAFPPLETPGRKDRPISGVVPPYWRHQRAVSRASLASVGSSKPAITLEDHSEDPEATSTRGLWAKSVTIEDHAVVSGKTGIGAYVVWMCRVQTLDGGPMLIPMRYSEFDELRELLAKAFPLATNALPPLPPKSVLFKFRPKFLESRRVGLQYFLHCVLLNPEFSGSPVLRDFLFARLN